MFRTSYFQPLFATLGILFACVPAAESQSALPRRLTLPQAENLLIERNLTVLAARYQIEANRAARLIASYRPNPVLTMGAEQIPFYSPLAGSFPRFLKTNPDAGANPVYTLRIDKIWERGGKRELRTSLADEQLQASEAQMLDAVRTQMYQLRRAFTAATLARENLRLAETSEQQYAQTQALTQVKVDQGDIARVEIYRVTAGRLQYQQAVLQARTGYDAATRDVLNLLGAREQDIAPAIAQTPGLLPVSAGSGDPQIPDSPGNAALDLISDFDDQPVFQSIRNH